MKRILIGAAAASMAMSGLANAAALNGVAGDVRVNRGNGYTVVQGAADLKPGDLVMLGGKSKARLVYADGCSVNVRPGAVTAVAAKSPCSQMQAQAPGGQQQPGGGTLFDGIPDVAVAGAAALVIAGGVGGGLAVANGGKTNPQSSPGWVGAPPPATAP